MAILLDLGVAAPHQNYDVTSRASNDAGFFKILTHVFSYPNAPFCQVIAKSEQVGFFWYTLIYSLARPEVSFNGELNTLFTERLTFFVTYPAFCFRRNQVFSKQNLIAIFRVPVKSNHNSWRNTIHSSKDMYDVLERPTLASRVPLFLLGHFPTNECEISDFCL